MSDNNNNAEKRRSNKKKGKKKKKFSFFKIFILITFLCGFIGTGIVGGMVYAVIKSTPEVDFSQMGTLLNENSFILDDKGELVEKVKSDSLRTIVKYDKIPKDVINAFLAIEDRSFFEHKGINPKRIVGAFIENVKAGAAVQGGSTITQQLVKNLYLTNEKSLDRKIKEAYYSIKMDNELTKEQILEAYLNTAYLGGGAKGVQGASYFYFSKDVSELDLAESALIAGITKNPSKYSPLKTLKKEDVDPKKHIVLDDSDQLYTIVYDDRYRPRQELVLSIMKSEGMITPEAYDKAMSEDMATHLKPGKSSTFGISSYFTDKVKYDVIESLQKQLNVSAEEASDMLYNKGLRIYTTLDVNMQKTVEAEYKKSSNFPSLVSRKNSAGDILAKNGRVLLYKKGNLINSSNELVIPKTDYTYDPNGNLVLNKNKRFNFYPSKKDGQVVDIVVRLKDAYRLENGKEYLILKGGNLNIPAEFKSFDSNNNLVIKSSFFTSYGDFAKKDGRGNLLLSKKYYYLSDKGAIQPQSAMVIMDYHTGHIKALVGGRDIKGQKLYNRALNPRPPGSSIKPIGVYTPAIDNGFTAASIIDDIPHYENGKMWPKNWYRDRFKGLSSIKRALQLSMNVVAVKVGEQVGVNTSVDYLKKMGISTIVEKGPYNDMNLAAVALGGMTKGISPLELTAAYGTLANEGVYIQPVSFTKITDKDGNIVIENVPTKNRVVSPQVSFIMTDMLKSVVSWGTATRAKFEPSNSNIPVAGKTGTTSNNYDAWFAGYTPYYVGAVWIGNDTQMKLNQGSSVSTKLWQNVMSKIHKNLPHKNFKKPDGIVSVAVDTVSGKLPTELSYRDPQLGEKSVKYEYFISGTQPTEYDEIHVELEVDTSTNKLAGPNCPPTLIEKRVFRRRTIPYIPENNNGIVPTDYIYEAPTATCDVHLVPENNDSIFNDIIFPLMGDDNNNNNNNNDEVIPPDGVTVSE
ncbi:MAG: PBP1A family penicillin-binding protein [Anaeromicrobium sp.]|jgi:penicillin-binding protein 1A|uniref:transglycosylase domain-containing protein n=1 Tax=Anaeromicrobium sp. TaxID=1929132 RepID=UPI0025D2D02A|nr:PBP1A family penicillin-binding protein [Anaeromicrobium sp.]MCT4593309.1 PBP1A family penicillin-binding protein [Anaeromicrobium sp.]